jgi:predicted enzyme related to lactoylglutathione lyase
VRLRFIYMPVSDLAAAKSFYLEQLGATLAWEEGSTTCGVVLPGDHVQVLLDEDPSDQKPGPFYVVPDVRAFVDQHPELTLVRGPQRISPGWYAAFDDADGNRLRIMDDSHSAESG